MREFLISWREHVLREIPILNEGALTQTVQDIFATIKSGGGNAYIVGGAVRDDLIPSSPPSKDVDFVVTGLPLDKLQLILSELGRVDSVGKSFGVLKAIINGEEFDFALPRTEKKVGDKHTDFEIVADHTAPVESDMARRDFTMNALLQDSEGNIIDIFGGVQDIENELIRTVGNPNERFDEDPLRILRALQFAVRFGFNIESETMRGIKNNVKRLSSVAGERIFMEFEKAWTKGLKNNIHFQQMLVELGIGEVIFGYDFDPIPVDVFPEPDDNVKANFIALFLKGGNFARIVPTREMITLLEIAKQIYQGHDILSIERATRERLGFLEEVFKNMGKRKESKRIRHALDRPLTGRQGS